MIAILLALLLVVVGLVVAAFLGKLPIIAADVPTDTRAFAGLPGGALYPEDLENLRFDQVLRGYRMTEVDEVLARLQTELSERDAEIALLREERVHDGLVGHPEEDSGQTT
ncbi:DivIVA domain-containing protein [Dermacoccaceae bacterium W4C1]